MLQHHANLHFVYVYFPVRSFERDHMRGQCWSHAPVAAQSGGERAKLAPLVCSATNMQHVEPIG